MFTQFSEISARFIQADKSKGVKRLLFSPQYIEHKISTFKAYSSFLGNLNAHKVSIHRKDTYVSACKMSY